MTPSFYRSAAVYSSRSPPPCLQEPTPALPRATLAPGNRMCYDSTRVRQGSQDAHVCFPGVHARDIGSVTY